MTVGDTVSDTRVSYRLILLTGSGRRIEDRVAKGLVLGNLAMDGGRQQRLMMANRRKPIFSDTGIQTGLPVLRYRAGLPTSLQRFS